ncbi:hypothetical protein [Paraliomyxa miuraensis]|uniref:hypothetical protein n=1 Tax=Paraliomyxa miuraensis TaxID=376150 RepID=UPI00224E2D02|nr:hypothetical protein [Paraliomyxa miuraensis]MCX4239148.1 hypothetical protein [Paraliomyxa miuraensis]
MSPTKISLVVLSLCMGLLAGSASAAAGSSSGCDARLVELAATEQARDEMEQAVVVIDGDRQALRIEASRLAAIIAERTRGGASDSELASLVERRAKAQREAERLDARIVLLQRQLDALVSEVDRVERGYLACIERSLES